jgi:curli biogenesis system outer membrane secretion channel CsgG
MSRIILASALVGLVAVAGVGLSGCATEASQALPVAKVEAAATAYRGRRVPVMVSKFDNRSAFLRGVFSDGVDRLGGQAKTVLISHLQQSQRFGVMDRDNLAEAKQEAQYKTQAQSIRGADFVISGDVPEFGRKEIGDQQLFGLMGRGKSQIAYAKVTVNVINSNTSEVVYSVQGSGEYSLSNREVVGFGGTASYDATLNGKVLDLAIREAVNHLVESFDAGAWGAAAAAGKP